MASPTLIEFKNSSGVAINYERLEFLGDAMLDAVISKYLCDEVLKEMKGYLYKNAVENC